MFCFCKHHHEKYEHTKKITISKRNMAAVGGPEGRKSSLFEVQKATPANFDLGTSSLSLSDVPSIAKRGNNSRYFINLSLF